MDHFWTRLWKISIPSKIKINLWRIYHHSIPTADVLLRRQINTNPACKLCGYKLESADHLFLKCWWSRVLWDSLVFPCAMLDPSFPDPATWLYSWMMFLSVESFTVAAIAIWYIWYARNQACHANHFITPSEAIFRIRSYCKLFKSANMQSLSTACLHGPSFSWSRPPQGSFKLNCDGAWNAESKEGAFGCVIRDSSGLVLACSAGFLSFASSPLKWNASLFLRVYL